MPAHPVPVSVAAEAELSNSAADRDHNPNCVCVSIRWPHDGAGRRARTTANLYGATNFTILWGSPDTYNHITFYSGLLGSGSVLSTAGGSSGTDFIGSDTGCYTTTCNRFAWDLVFFSSSLPIGSVVLSNDGTAAFEYGLAPINTPLPTAVWLFGTVIAAAAGASRMRRRAKAA